MTILYALLIMWVVFGLLLYITTMVAFKCDVVTISAILKDEGAVLEWMEISKQYDKSPIINKVAFFLFMLFTSPLLFVLFLFKSIKGVVKYD